MIFYLFNQIITNIMIIKINKWIKVINNKIYVNKYIQII